MASTYISADSVFKLTYDSTVDIRSLKETEGVSERVMIWWENSVDNQRLPIRLSTNRIENDRADRHVTGADNILLVHVEIR